MARCVAPRGLRHLRGVEDPPGRAPGKLYRLHAGEPGGNRGSPLLGAGEAQRPLLAAPEPSGTRDPGDGFIAGRIPDRSWCRMAAGMRFDLVLASFVLLPAGVSAQDNYVTHVYAFDTVPRGQRLL